MRQAFTGAGALQLWSLGHDPGVPLEGILGGYLWFLHWLWGGSWVSDSLGLT